MKFHATIQLKNGTEKTFHPANVLESTVNTQTRPLQKIVSQIINFQPYISTCHFMSLSHAQILIKHGEFINIFDYNAKLWNLGHFSLKNGIF